MSKPTSQEIVRGLAECMKGDFTLHFKVSGAWEGDLLNKLHEAIRDAKAWKPEDDRLPKLEQAGKGRRRKVKIILDPTPAVGKLAIK